MSAKEKLKDGGPAFPVLGYDKGASGDIRPQPTIYDGMTLRDYFAAKALQGLLSRSSMDVPHYKTCRHVGEDAGAHYSDIAYRYADSMMDARTK